MSEEPQQNSESDADFGLSAEQLGRAGQPVAEPIAVFDASSASEPRNSDHAWSESDHELEVAGQSDLFLRFSLYLSNLI